MRFKFIQWDMLGISVSVLCALHCVGLPLFFSSFSIWAPGLLHHPGLEAGLIGLSLLFGGLAFYKGCFVQHKRKWPLLLFVLGMGLLLLNQRVEQYTLYLIPAATVLIVWAHVANYRQCRQACCTR